MNCFDPVCFSPTKKENCIAIRIKFKVILNDIKQSTQLLPHIGIPGTDINMINMQYPLTFLHYLYKHL